MSDGMVRKWVRMFNEGRENVLHNNVRLHSAAQTQDLITSFTWEQMDHSRTALIWRQLIFTSSYT